IEVTLYLPMENDDPALKERISSVGALGVGMRVKSGHRASLKTFLRSVLAHSVEAQIVTGSLRRPMIRSAIIGRSFTWSKWLWVTRMLSTLHSSFSASEVVSAPASN